MGEIFYLRQETGKIIDMSTKKDLHNGRRQSKELQSSHWTRLAREILIMVGLLGVVVSAKLVHFSFASASISGLCMPPYLVDV